MATIYDLVVIGGGSAGLTAVEVAVGLQVKRILLVDDRLELGGECLYAGCIPSKALIKAARAVHSASTATQFGVHADVKVDFEEVRRHVENAINHIRDDTENDEYFIQKGVEVIHGKVAFVSKNTISVNGTQIQAGRFIIATGSSPKVPTMEGLEGEHVLTNETVFKLKTLPRSMLVIGGGPIGCELGQSFAHLGTSVTIVQHGDRLLPKEDIEASDALLAAFNQNNIEVLFNTDIERIEHVSKGVDVTLLSGSERSTKSFEKILVATGRRPNLLQGLDRAGIQYDEKGIHVDNTLRTSNSRVYAAGDVTGQYQFTHYAVQQATKACVNAMTYLSSQFKPKHVPWATFTTPEIATVTVDSQKDPVVDTIRLDYSHFDKAVTDGASGFIKLDVSKHQKILKATIVGENAGEVLGRFCIAIEQGIKADSLVNGMQPYPTMNFGIDTSMNKLKLAKLQKNPWIRFITR